VLGYCILLVLDAWVMSARVLAVVCCMRAELVL